jgi:hypothetical protein
VSRPDLDDRFAGEELDLDVWLTFLVDGEEVRRVGQAPDHPVQPMLGVFDFPAKADPAATGPPPVPELVVSHVRGHPLG